MTAKPGYPRWRMVKWKDGLDNNVVSLTILKADAQRMAWSYRFKLWQVHTHTHTQTENRTNLLLQS